MLIPCPAPDPDVCARCGRPATIAYSPAEGQGATLAYCSDQHITGRRVDEVPDGTLISVPDPGGVAAQVAGAPPGTRMTLDELFGDAAPLMRLVPGFAAFEGTPEVGGLSGDFTLHRVAGGAVLTHTSGATFTLADDFVFDWPRFHLPRELLVSKSGGQRRRVLRKSANGGWSYEGAEAEWREARGGTPDDHPCWHAGEGCTNLAVAESEYRGSGHIGYDRVAHCADHGLEHLALNPPRGMRAVSVTSRRAEDGSWHAVHEVLYQEK